MPIYEYHCIHCDKDFERLEMKISDTPVAQCPHCHGAALKIMSAPAIVYEDLKTRMSPDRLPNWHQNNKRAEWQDAWMRYRQKNPLPNDRGPGIKVYESDGVKEGS